MKYLLALLVVFLAGCTAVQTGSGVTLTLEPETYTIEPSTPVKIFATISNEENSRIDVKSIYIFSTGVLTGEPCNFAVGTLEKYERRNYICQLKSPPPEEIPKPYIRNSVLASVKYTAEMDVTKDFEVISFDEYEKRRLTGRLDSQPQSAVFSDGNIQATVEFSDGIPVVRSPGKDVFLYINIKNVGSGFVDPLGPESIRFSEETSPLLDSTGCLEVLKGGLPPYNNEFPRIACRLNMNVFQGDADARRIVMSVSYGYEKRAETEVEIRK